MKFKAKKNSGTPTIRVSQSTYQKTVLKEILAKVVLAFIGVLLIYLVVAAFLMRVMPTSAGLILTKNNTYPGAILPLNSQILVDLNPEAVSTVGPLDNLKSAFIPQKNVALVEVLAGPIGELKWASNVLTVDGKPLVPPFYDDPNKKFLENEYIGVCIAGDCTPGLPLIFGQNQTKGVPLTQDREIPETPPAPVNDGPDRSNAEQVVKGYIIEGYYGNTDLACSLTSQQFRDGFGRPDGCAIDASSFSREIPADFESFDKLVVTEGKKFAGGKRMNYRLELDNRVVAGQFTIMRTTDGWTIDQHKRGVKK